MKSILSVFALCGLLVSFPVQASPEIHGGRKVRPGEEIARFAVAVKHGSPGSEQYCSGALIARRTVLTAAHCIEGTIAVHFGVDAEKSTERYPITAIHLPAEYRAGRFDHDLAVLNLDEDAPAGYEPIAIGEATPEVADHAEVEVAGYGLNDPGILRTTTLAYAEKEAKFLRLKNRLPETGTDHGDSGGPAFVRRDGAYVLVGTLMGGNDEMALYTRLELHRTWIDAKTAEAY